MMVLKQQNAPFDIHTKAEDTIAVVGIACRFPGAANPEAFWQLLCSQSDAITDIPSNRFDVNAFYDSQPTQPGKMVNRWGGFLEDISGFDYAFFGISPREAANADPQHRLLLEVAWEALEDASEVPGKLAGSRTGVFIGQSYNDYEDLQARNLDDLSIYTITGSSRSVTSGRLSYALDLRGPSLTVDTACSSSLVAIHLASQSLRCGESSLALAGGVNLILQPDFSIGFSQAQVLSPDGRCKAFDASANGFVRSEGVGVVVLKPLRQAQADGNPIYAIIRGSAVANDGRSSGLLITPGEEGQEQTLRAAYQDAGVNPDSVQYIEAHGTGTNVGDPVEVAALAAVLCEGRNPSNICFLGSAKTNIGHTEATAGVAGFIKTVLCLKHRMIPPNLHFQTPNPSISWESLPFVVPRECTALPPSEHPIIAGVSAFGISGTNAHIVLEEVPKSVHPTQHQEAATPYAQLLTLSTHTPDALRAMAQKWHLFMASTPSTLSDICYTASIRRTHHENRLALVARSKIEVAQHLEAFLDGATSLALAHGQHMPGTHSKLVFVFPGQGSQWLGMGRVLLEQEAVFRSALEACEQAMRPYVDWLLFEQLLASSEKQEQWQEIDRIQPTIFAIQVALVALWRSWGVIPDAVVGHSMGEVAAAHVAGILSLDAAARIICGRSKLLKRVSGQGAMAVTGLSLGQAEQAIHGYEDRLAVAVSNSPNSTVLSGDPVALAEVMSVLQSQNIFCRSVKVDVASHSPQMDPLREDLLQLLEGMQPQQATIPLYSTVTNTIGKGPEFNPSYWSDNLRKPVLFSLAVQQLLTDNHDVFVEISPHPILLSAIQQILQNSDHHAIGLASMRRDEDERTVLLETLASLYTLDISIAWEQLYPANSQPAQLPSYPWQHENCWLETENGEHRSSLSAQAASRYLARGKLAHPLLRKYIRSATQTGTHYWEIELHSKTLPYLSDHSVQGATVFPTTAYIEMALAAAIEIFDIDKSDIAIEQLSLHKALFLHEDRTTTLQLVATASDANAFHFQFFAFSAEESSGAVSLPTLHTSGIVNLKPLQQRNVEGHFSVPDIQQRCTKTIDTTAYYQILRQRGLIYGPHFQGIDQIQGGDTEALAHIHLVEQIAAEASRYYVHPAFLDACFQAIVAAFPEQEGDIAATDTYLPVYIRNFYVQEWPKDATLWSYVHFQPADHQQHDLLEGDIYILDETGKVLLATEGLRVQRIDQKLRDESENDIRKSLYTVQWEETPRLEPNTALNSQQASWLVFDDGSDAGNRLTALLEQRGEQCIRVFLETDHTASYQRNSPTSYHVPTDSATAYQQLVEDVVQSNQLPLRGIVHLWSLNIPPATTFTSDTLRETLEYSCTSVLHLIQALAQVSLAVQPRLFLVTKNAQPADLTTPLTAIQAPLWGMGRVIFLEHPELRCKLVNLADGNNELEITALYQELWSDRQEEQVALRGERRYIARFMPYTVTPNMPDQYITQEQAEITVGPDHPFRLETTKAGLLDNLILREIPRSHPGAGEVEIQVYMTGLNFHDVMLAMGIDIGDEVDGQIPFGVECVGRVTTLGEGVTDFQVGDEVIAVSHFCFASYIIASAKLVIAKPAVLSFEEAVTLPVAFLTAYYALYHLGRLNAGERVLIHSATGGVGLAAIQLAQLAGAEIFATAGSPEKRAFLQSLGVQHVMDSRSLVFADDIMTLTNGQGVDLVLNSLAGEALTRSLALLAPYGRFLEIGKRDIYQNKPLGLGPFENSLSFFSIDLDRMIWDCKILDTLLPDIMHLLAEGKLKPLPYTAFSVGEISNVFRQMTQARHIGKLIVSLREPELVITAAQQKSSMFSTDATYLITGGLGGLGLTIAGWMAERGAQHIVLLGRHEASTAAQRVIDALQHDYATSITVVQADITQEQQVIDTLETLTKSMPPLQGIMHCAGILEDSTLLQMSHQSLLRVMAPKVLGAWHLHRWTQSYPLDFFVLFSSAAGLFGSPGQSNYSAANTFLDALAHERRAQNLPAISINWGPWTDIGLAAIQDNRGKRLSYRGIGSFTPAQGLEALELLMAHNMPQVAVAPFHLDQWCQFYPPASMMAFFARLAAANTNAQSSSDKHANFRQSIQSAAPEERLELIMSYLSERISKVLGFKQMKLDIQHPLNRLGIDSLMAVEIRNVIETDTGIVVPVTLFLQGNNLKQLSQRVHDQLTLNDDASLATVVQPAVTSTQVDVSHLSDQEVDALLNTLLAQAARQDVSTN